jgi:hypothetical protein
MHGLLKDQERLTQSKALEPISKLKDGKKAVIPAEAGIKTSAKILDSRFHGNDKKEP